MRTLVILATVLALASGTAHAERSRKTAVILSSVGTGVSSALVLSAFMVAPSGGTAVNKPLMYTGLASAVILPSAGEIYAGEYVTIGMAVRVGAAGLATYALTNKVKTGTCDDAQMSGSMCTSLEGSGIALLGVAAIAFIGGMAYDVDDAPSAADRYNASHGIGVTAMSPMIPTANGPAPGLSLAGHF